MTQKTVVFDMNKRPTETVELPSFPESRVTLYRSILTSEQQDIATKYKVLDNETPEKKSEKEFLATLELLKKAIKEWNFVDSEKKPLEITTEVLSKFAMVDLFIMQEVVTGRKLTEKREDGSVYPLALEVINDQSKKK